MNPLTISLMIAGSAVGYVSAGVLTYKFLWDVRRWHSTYADEERFICCVLWPITMSWWTCYYTIRGLVWLIIWLVKLPFRPLKVRAARIKRSGKNYRGEIVK